MASYEELDARVLLLLKSDGGDRPLPVVVCDAERAWLEWDGRRFEISDRGSMADEVVDIVEAELQAAGRKREAEPKTPEPAASVSGELASERSSDSEATTPARGRPADPQAKRAVDARGGGICTSLETEAPSKTISTAIGPAFDVGSSVGPVLLGGREAFRFSVSGHQVAFMDFEGAVAMGAPLNPDARFGAALRLGAEWMIAYPEGNSGQATVVPVAELGARVAHSYGLVGIWAGLDARVRLQTLSLHSSGLLRANDLGASLSLGVAFVDWSRK